MTNLDDALAARVEVAHKLDEMAKQVTAKVIALVEASELLRSDETINDLKFVDGKYVRKDGAE